MPARRPVISLRAVLAELCRLAQNDVLCIAFATMLHEPQAGPKGRSATVVRIGALPYMTSARRVKRLILTARTIQRLAQYLGTALQAVPLLLGYFR
jgi:hypothetical protein